MSVVTEPELANYLSGMKITDIQQQSLTAILAGVQSELERYLNRPIQERRVFEEAELQLNGCVYLKVTPIKAVYGIYPSTLLGEPSMDHPIRPNSNFFRLGANYLNLGCSYGTSATVHVDYRGGMNADLDPGVKLAIMRVAAREFMHNHGDAMTLSNTEARPGADPVPIAKGWTPDELKQFDRLRRRVVL